MKEEKPRMNGHSCLIVQNLKQKLHKKVTWNVTPLVLGYIMFGFLFLCILCVLEILNLHVNGQTQNYISRIMKGNA